MLVRPNHFLLVGTLFYFISHVALSQCPSVGFTIKPNSCIDENISVSNQSSSGTYYWDFCTGDFNNPPTAQFLFSLSQANGRPALELVKDGNKWFGFVTGTFSNVLYRLEFGNGPESSPTFIENLGSLSGKLSSPGSLRLLYENNKWYGIIYNTGSGELLKLSFGDKLSNSITTTLLYTNTPYINSGLALGKDPVNGWVCVLTTGTNQLSILRLGNTISPPTLSDILTSPSVPNPNNIGDIDLVNNCGNWFGFNNNLGNSNMYRLSFGSNLFSVPVITQIASINAANPGRLKMIKDGEDYFLLTTALDGTLTKFSFGADLNSTPSIAEEGSLGGVLKPNTYGIAAIRNDSRWTTLALHSTGEVYKISYPDNCSAIPASSTLANPKVKFNSAGNYSISLEASSAELTSTLTKPIVVSSLVAPDINFTSQNICAGSNINFGALNLSGSVVGYSWNFGDSGISSLANPTHTYALAGDYIPSLIVTATNGCQNKAENFLTIYNQPTAVFILPSSVTTCTNQNYQFVNQSTFDFPSNPTWQWNVNGSNVSTTKDLTSNFSTTYSQTIQLTASIPGCSSQSTQLFNVQQQGPLVDFTLPPNGCQSTSLSLTNNTSGSVTSYAWDFGDGNTSTSTNGINTYSNTGTYNIKLQTSNAAGCQNSITKPITIYSKPQANFSIGLPPFSCAGTSSQFTDTTPSPTDSNLTAWNWNFGNSNNGTSTFKNPTYTYPTSNNYNVSLTVGTNFGCGATVQKSITISPSPVASFTNSAACVNQVTQFTDASSGSIQSRQWQIQGNIFSAPNPQFAFSSSNTFPVQLTVTGTNGCINQISKNILVPIAPTLDFTVQVPCANSPTAFTEVTNSVDPVVSRGWVFGSLANGSGSPAQFSFPTPNTYLVKLNSTRQSGCVYTVSKNVSIISPPIADFTTSIDAGPAPLNVSFVNNSIQATSYQWMFGDKNNSVSALINPAFIFSDLDDYTVQLKASNAFNCSNTFSRIINVVIPKIDLIMNDFYLTNDPSGAAQPTISILSKSNVTVTDPVVLLTSSDGAQVKKKIIGTLKPNQELIQQLDFLIVPRASNYLCAEVLAPGDVDLFQNRKCLTLTGDEILFVPFPNPAKEQLNLDWISADGSDVSFQVINSTGSIFLQQSVSGILKGINRLAINTSNLAAGIYFIRFKDSKKDKAFNFIVLGN